MQARKRFAAWLRQMNSLLLPTRVSTTIQVSSPRPDVRDSRKSQEIVRSIEIALAEMMQ